MSRPRLMIVVASTRPGRVGLPVAQWFRGRAEEHGAFEPDWVDLAELNLPFLDEPNHPRLRRYTQQHTRDWSARVEAADAFVFVMPEYNHGFCAPLKNALDFVFEEWAHKPVGFVSYGGISAGTRAVQLLKPILLVLKITPLAEAVSIPFVGKAVKDGALDTNEHLDHSADTMLEELVRVEAALRPMRTPAPA